MVDKAKCIECKEIKDASFFTPGYKKCNSCINKRNREYYSDSPRSKEQSRERVRRWREKKKRERG